MHYRFKQWAHAFVVGKDESCITLAGFLTLALVGLVQPADATTFHAKRGINLDIWDTWPDETSWGDAKVLLPYPEWRKTLTSSDLADIKADGFDLVRMPVDPAPLLSPGAAKLHERLVDSVRESVRLLNGAGLKVIVDLHLIPAGEKRSLGMKEVMDDPQLFDRYVDLVREMADAFSHADPAQVAFEPMNEPVIDCEKDGTNLWAERQKRLFAAARSSATRLTLVLTGACFSSAEQLAKVDPKDFPDDNVLWTFHSYDPFVLTHQGATWAGDFIRYVTGIPFPPSSEPRAQLDATVDAIKATIDRQAMPARRNGMKAYLDELIGQVDTVEKVDEAMDRPFALVADWAAHTGVAPTNIMLGEFGMIRQEWGNPYVMPAASRAAYYGMMIERAEAHGFGWSAWSFGGPFGLVRQFEDRAAEPDVIETIRNLPR